MTNNAKICGACGHSAELHLLSAAGTLPCTTKRSGKSDSGIIGLPWEWQCPCKDFSKKITTCRVCNKPVFLHAEETRPKSQHWEGPKAPIREADEPIHLACAKPKRRLSNDWLSND